MFYSIPFQPKKFLHGERYPQISLIESVKQNIKIMVRSKWPEECKALPGFGSLMRKYVLLSQDKDTSLQRLKSDIQKNIKESLIKSIERYERRMEDTSVTVKFMSIVYNDSTSVNSLNSFPLTAPYTFYLKILVTGRLNGDTRVINIYEEIFPLG